VLCFVIGGDNIAAVVLMVHPTVNNVDGGGAKGVMESFAGNGTSHPTNMQIETVSLYCIFVVSFLYLWLTIYAIRQVFGIVCTKEKESLSSKSVRQRYLTVQFATAFHGAVRFCLLIMAYFTDTSSTSTSTTQLRRAVLGDIPGFIFVIIYMMILNDVHSKFSNYFNFTASSNPSTPLLMGTPQSSNAGSTASSPESSEKSGGVFDMTSRSMRSRVGRLKQRLKPKMRDSDTLRIFLVFVFATALLSWLILIVFISSNDQGNALNFEGKQLNEIRDGLFFALFLVVVVLGVFSLYRIRWIDDEAYVVRQFGFATSSLSLLLHTIAITFFVRFSAVSVTMFDMRETGRPVLIIPNSDVVDLVFSVVYYIVCELICANVTIHVLRNRLFTDDHDEVLERGALPENLEISPMEIVDLEAVGSGGYGIVYRAIYRSLPVAVKKFHPKLGNEVIPLSVHTEQRRRFVQEAQILCKLRSPRVVNMLGFTYFPKEKSFALVMEYIERGSLFKILHGSNVPLNIGGAVMCAERIAEGLVFLHASGIIHRDLKSGNILIDDSFNPKICDFGLSKQFLDEDSFSSMPSAHGTVSWSAPELLLGRECTTKVDIYSFAFILWELLARAIPHRRLQNAEVIYGVLGRKQLRPPVPNFLRDQEMDASDVDGWKLCKSAEEDLLQILKCGWSPDPVKRPNASLMLEQLRKWRESAPKHFLSIELIREQVKLEQKKAKMKARMAAKKSTPAEAKQ
jgi:tRNA A-37 threonylcarbamoyl transferase component Bud32